MPKTLLLRLEGALQSWGERGRWSVRDSAPEPTKSGVIGLIGCAMGVADDTTLRMLSAQTQMGVRVDQPGIRLTDYHTIGGGYDQPALLTAQGKPKKSSGRPHTEISLRDYLCNASFLVALQSTDESLVDQMAHALQNPVWTIFLGRKSCPPSQPVFVATQQYNDLFASLKANNWSDGINPLKPNQPRRLRTMLECQPQEEGSVRRRDHLYSRRYRTFHPRYTRAGRSLWATMDDNGLVTIQEAAP